MGVVLIVYIDDAVRTHVLCDMLQRYKKGLAPVGRVCVLIVENEEQSNDGWEWCFCSRSARFQGPRARDIIGDALIKP